MTEPVPQPRVRSCRCGCGTQISGQGRLYSRACVERLRAERTPAEEVERRRLRAIERKADYVARQRLNPTPKVKGKRAKQRHVPPDPFRKRVPVCLECHNLAHRRPKRGCSPRHILTDKEGVVTIIACGLPYADQPAIKPTYRQPIPETL